MDYQKLLKKFRIRMWKEAIVKSLVAGMNGGLVLAVLSVIIMKCIQHEWTFVPVMITGLVGFLICTGLFLVLVFRPNQQKIARRIDQAGLKERVVTMLDYQEVTGFMIEKQREDAVTRLEGLSPDAIPRSYVKKYLVFPMVLAILLTLACVIPFGEDTAASAIEEESARQEALVDQLIAQLRAIVDAADLESNLKDQLYEIVNNLELSFDEEDTTLTRTAKISESMKILESLEASLVVKNKIAEYLGNNSDYGEVANALAEGDVDGMSAALTLLAASITEEDKVTLTSLLQSSAESAKNLSADGVADAFATAATALGVEDSDTGTILDHLIASITEPIAYEVKIENTIEQMLALMTTSENEIAGITTEEETTQAEEETSPSENETSESESQSQEESESKAEESKEGESQESPPEDGSMPEGESGQTGEEETTEAEKIYDPDATEAAEETQDPEDSGGNIPYSEVFDQYYSDALQDLTDDEISDELRDMIEQYYTSLK